MNDYAKKIKTLISHNAGVELPEMTNESHLADDLNLGELEITELIEEIEEMFDVDLTEYKDTIETVGDLITGVAECLE